MSIMFGATAAAHSCWCGGISHSVAWVAVLMGSLELYISLQENCTLRSGCACCGDSFNRPQAGL